MEILLAIWGAVPDFLKVISVFLLIFAGLPFVAVSYKWDIEKWVRDGGEKSGKRFPDLF